MEREFFTWENLIVWAVCSMMLYLSLSFRLYTLFHRRGRKQGKRATRERTRTSPRVRLRPLRKSLGRREGDVPAS